MRTEVAGKTLQSRMSALALFITVAAWASAAVASTPLSAPQADADVAALEAKVGSGATLPELIALARRSNPMIRAARAAWQGVRQKYRVDTAWEDPEVMAEGMYAAEMLGDSAKPMDWSIGVTQAVPLWGRRRSAGALTRTEEKIAEAKLDAAIRDVTYAVRRSAQELRYLAEAKQIAQAQQALVATLTTAGAAAYAGERASLFDVMKARAQSGQVDYDALLLETSERTERARLNALLNRAPDEPVGPITAADAPALAFSVAEIDAFVEDNFEDLRVARAEVERAEAMTKLARYETLPEVKLGVSYGSRDGVNQVGVQAGLMLPLRFEKNAARLGAVRADVGRMRAMYESQRNDARTAVRDLEFRLGNAARLVTLYRDDLVPQAERALEMAQVRLDRGQGSLSDAAEARSAWYSFRLALARARADHGTLLARLESMAGRPLTAGEGGSTAPPASRTESFADVSQRLHTLSAELEKTLAATSDEAAFLAPDGERAQALAAAATDENAAGTTLSDGFTLETLETLTLLRNPMIATKEREARAALEGFDQAEQIDVVLRRYRSLTGDSTGGPGGMGRSQEFPFPGVLALKGRIVAEGVRAAREELEAARRDALTMARTSYWELLYLDSAAEATRGMLALLENVTNSVAARYEAGETSFQDVVRVRIEREKLREELKTLHEERRNMEAEIRGLLALSPGVAIGLPARRETPGTAPAQADLEVLALKRRQELRAADAMVGRMELMLEMAETMTYPGFDLGVFTPRTGLAAPVGEAAGMEETAAGGGVMAAAAGMAEAPARPFFAGDEAYVREVRQRIAALKSEREATRAATLVGVRNAWFALDRARREAALYGERLLTLSQSAIEASLRGYTAGRVMFSDLLESYLGWLEANLARERARADIGIARAGLEAAVGTADLELSK